MVGNPLYFAKMMVRLLSLTTLITLAIVIMTMLGSFSFLAQTPTWGGLVLALFGSASVVSILGLVGVIGVVVGMKFAK